MSARKFATLDFKERQEIVQGIYEKILPDIQKVMNDYLSKVEPELGKLVRNEVGKFAVTEKQAHAFLEGMIATAAEKSMNYFRPAWLARLLFRRRTE